MGRDGATESGSVKPPRRKVEIWVTRQEFEEWGIAKAKGWEIAEIDHVRERLKVRKVTDA